MVVSDAVVLVVAGAADGSTLLSLDTLSSCRRRAADLVRGGENTNDIGSDSSAGELEWALIGTCVGGVKLYGELVDTPTFGTIEEENDLPTLTEGGGLGEGVRGVRVSFCLRSSMDDFSFLDCTKSLR